MRASKLMLLFGLQVLSGAALAFDAPVRIDVIDGDTIGPYKTELTRAPSGWLAAVWQHQGDYHSLLGTAASGDGGLTWSDPVYLEAGWIFDPVIVASGSARLDLAWDDGGEWIYHARSLDGGATWGLIRPVMEPTAAFDMAVSESGTIAILNYRADDPDKVELTLSTTGGASWSVPVLVGSGDVWESIMVRWTGATELIACWGEDLREPDPDPQFRIACRRSSDSGASFGPLIVAARSGPGRPEWLEGTMAQASDSELWLAYQALETGVYVVHSYDAGLSWSRPHRLSAIPDYHYVLVVSATPEGRYVAISPTAVYFSLTGGSWSSTALPSELACTEGSIQSIVSLGESAVAATSRSVVWRTVDRGDSWGEPGAIGGHLDPVRGLTLVATPAGELSAFWSGSSRAPSTIVDARSLDGGATWTPGSVTDELPSLRPSESSVHAPAAVMASRSSESLFAIWLASGEDVCSEVRISRSDFGGVWEPSAAFARPGELPVSIAEDGSARIVALWREGDGVVASRSFDAGASWTAPETIVSKPASYDSFYMTPIVADPDGGLVFVTNEYRSDPEARTVRIFRSTDGGLSWLESNFVPPRRPYEMRLMAGGSRLFLAIAREQCRESSCAPNYDLYEQPDSAEHWLELTTIGFSQMLAADELDNLYWVGVGVGNWLTRRSGATGVIELLEVLPESSGAPAGLGTGPGEIAIAYSDPSASPPGVYFLKAGTELFRDDSIATLDPRPDLAAIFPLQSATAYLASGVVPGMRDPDPLVLGDSRRPLVLYGLRVPSSLMLVKAPGGLVQLFW